ncbi:hypothetical protein [Phreatobacter sp. AB_2022a]|jgi:hypothetical protein|uniref:hypothetical protein n=1 Tax=Phreatobacter sp. AB_2022a TaxID=3003134 RepID=UPI0022876C06|nr:hypothetical protein [Phreatobacter sp. AB_2022a]MCZ0738654.1 hypothetical protein [Phreatobacter sp. AB_2022a]
MKTQHIITAAALAIGLLGMASQASAYDVGEGSQTHSEAHFGGERGTFGRSSVYDLGNPAVHQNAKSDATANQGQAQAKKPGCKWYDGATHQHSWPQYEIGNTNRADCPPESH